jgi:N-methylhydantoinase B
MPLFAHAAVDASVRLPHLSAAVPERNYPMRGGDIGLIDLQIMWNRLIAVVEEQAQVLLRTAFSPIVRECGDLSAGVFDRHGRMLAQAVTGTPGHVNSMAESVKHFIRHFPVETMAPGDAYITNDPWMGTGHLNDFVITTPCFKDGRLVALFSCTSHLMDIGGIGFGPDATDVFMEGLYIPMLKLIDRGTVNETLMAMIRANTRLPVDTEGDVYSLAGCNDVGARRLVEMMEEFGIDTLDPLADHIVTHSRAAVLEEVGRLPRGCWRNSMTVDGYDAPVTLAAALTVSDTGIHVDFTGTSPQSRRGINVPLAYTTAYTVFGLGCVVASKIPNNAGSLGPLTVAAPAGSILNAPKPAPVAIRHVIGQMLPDVVFGCLRQVIPERVPAEGTSCLWNLIVRGETQGGAGRNYGFSMAITSNGGTGARPDKDGLSATAYPSGVRGTPVEIAETETPLIFWRKELRPDSGGAGATRGGLGQIIEMESGIGRPWEILAAFDRIEHPARGRDGGHDGAAGSIGLKSGRTLRGKGFQEIPAGDRLVVHTPGGAGIGAPRTRERRRVANDLAQALVSPAAARETYNYAD